MYCQNNVAASIIGVQYNWEAWIVSLAHWGSLDRQTCIVSYSDAIVSMQYLYDIFAVLYYNMATVFILYVPPYCNFTK